MLTILSNIFALAYVGALDSKALDTVCAIRGGDSVLLANMRAAQASTEAAIAAALAPFGAKPHDKAWDSSYIYEGRTVTYAVDYITGARVRGPLLIGSAS